MLPETLCWSLAKNTPYTSTKKTLDHLDSDLNLFQGRFFDKDDRQKIASAVFSMRQHLEHQVGIKVDAFRHLCLDAQKRHANECPSIPVHEMNSFELWQENNGIESAFNS